MKEHRKSQRFDLRLPLEVVRSGNQPTSIHGQTLNLSSSGVLFQTETAPQVGEIIEYYITLPKAPNLDQEVHLRCMGKVLRTHEQYAAATMERYEFVRHRGADPSLAAAAVAS